MLNFEQKIDPVIMCDFLTCFKPLLAKILRRAIPYCGRSRRKVEDIPGTGITGVDIRILVFNNKQIAKIAKLQKFCWINRLAKVKFWSNSRFYLDIKTRNHFSK